MARPAVDVKALSREEQLELLDELWQVLERVPDALPLTDEQRRDLDERLDAAGAGDNGASARASTSGST